MADAKHLRVHKVRLEPNNVQRGHFVRAAGTARFAWNWALAEWQRQYAEHKDGRREKAPTAYSVRNDLTAIKHQQFPWMLDVSKCVPQEAIADLGDAYRRAFTRQNEFPKFKSKGKCKESFRLTGDHVSINRYDLIHDDRTVTRRSYLRIAKLDTWIKMSEHLRFEGRIIRVTISRQVDQWYASILVECEADDPALVRETEPMAESCERIGVDVGVHEFATSDGVLVPVPRVYRRRQRLVRRRSQSLARKVEGSNNYRKQRLRLARTHKKTADVRADFLHKYTSNLVRENSEIVIEHLHVKGMVKNKKLSKSLHDAAFGEFARQMKYKVEQTEDRVLFSADRWYPSSKLCSACGTKTKSMPLSVREWTCGACGAEHHRDINAAINLTTYPESEYVVKKNIAVGSTVTACGQFLASGLPTQVGTVKPPGRSRNPSSLSAVGNSE